MISLYVGEHVFPGFQLCRLRHLAVQGSQDLDLGPWQMGLQEGVQAGAVHVLQESCSGVA